MQFRAVDCDQRPQHRDERHPVEDEQPAGAQGAFQRGSQCGPNNTRPSHHGRVERDRVGDLLRLHQFDHEPTTRRIVECADDAQQQRQAVDNRQAHKVEQIQRSQGQRLGGEQTLRQQCHRAVVATVGHCPRPHAEQEHRQELAEQGDAHVGSTASELIHQQRHGRHLYPGADVADKKTDEEQTRVAMSQRAEHRCAGHRCPFYRAQSPFSGPRWWRASRRRPSRCTADGSRRSRASARRSRWAGRVPHRRHWVCHR